MDPSLKSGKFTIWVEGFMVCINYELSFTYRCVGEYYIENIMYMHLT